MINLKKKSVVGLLVCLVFLWSTPVMLWAAEADTARLIDLLKSKKVITPDEADSLLKEMDARAKEERAVAQEETKTAAEKGDFLPPALRGFKFGTTIYAEWNNKKPDNAASVNQFALNRAYITLTRDINDWLGMNITSDLFTSVDPADKDGLQLRLKYAFVNLSFYGTATQLGMIPTPSDAYDAAIWPFRVQGQNLLDAHAVQSTSDLGISNQGVFGGYMDKDYLKFATKQFAGKWGGYFVGLYNGAGFVNTEANNNKAPSGLIYIRPLPMVPILKGLQLAYFGTYGLSNNNFAPGQGVVTDYPKWRVNVGQVSLQHEYFTVMGQYYWGKGTYVSTEEHNRKGYLAAAFLRIPGLEELRIFGKYHYYDPDTDAANDANKTYIAGLSYDVTTEFMPFAAFEREKFDSAAAGTNYDKYQIGFQLKF
ncbi:MAG: hypothetical protein PHY31_04250 [Smithellaceae bacterium]|nr:hypothetical protein [Smithellaceae bacterium]